MLNKTAVWNSDQLCPGSDGLTLVGQLGQSLDGQIATQTGQSKYINDASGLKHLHELRAWADVVVVGVGTVVADNPRLSVRLVDGSDPDRVIIDPTGRLPADAICLADPHIRRVVLTSGASTYLKAPEGLEVCVLPKVGGTMDARDIRAWLGSQGWRRVLVEGGAKTLAQFLDADQLDCLHLITAPMLLGPGTPGLRGAVAKHLDQAKRFETKLYGLGRDLLIECSFR